MLSYRKNVINLLWVSVIALIVIFLDQISKWQLSSSFALGQSYALFSWLNINLQHNFGAAFGFLDREYGWQGYVISLIAILVCIGVIIWLMREPHLTRLRLLAVGLILGGTLGNLIDRLRFNYVIDFIDFHIKSWHFATFNIADSAITIGVIFLLLPSNLFESRKR